MENPTKTVVSTRKKVRLSKGMRTSMLVLVAGASGLLFACSFGSNPITSSERAEILASDHDVLRARQNVVDQPISLFEAMARALKYNLEHRVALLEKAVAQRQLELAKFSLLPEITANAAQKTRSTPEASSGYPVTTDGQPVPQESDAKSYSVAQDRNKTTANLTTVWNLLEFGVSVIEARQESDRVFIAKENQRKAVHDLLQRVRATFWQAAGAQKLDDAIVTVLRQARSALTDARQVEQERLKPPLEILRFQKTLLEIVRQLQDLRHQLSLAKTEFASLINLPPGTGFTLDIADDPALMIPSINMAIEEMEQLALDNRPELRKKMYEARISSSDVRKAMLRLLPNLNFQASHNWDNNSFTLYPQWEEAGATVAWNIWKLLEGPTTIRAAENKEELASMSRLAKHMAILTEVHLAFHLYLNDQRKLHAAEEIDAVDQRILKNISATSNNDAQNQLEYISTAAGAIMSRLQLYQAYADAQNAVGLIFATLGVDLAPKAVRSDEIPILAEALRDAVKDWNEGAANGPLQKLMSSLNSPPTKIVGSSSTSKPDTEAARQAERQGHAIPYYFLEEQFLPDVLVPKEERATVAENGGEKEKKSATDSTEPESFAAEALENLLQTATTDGVATKNGADVKKDADVKKYADVKKGVETKKDVETIATDDKKTTFSVWSSGETDIEHAKPELFAEIQNMVQAWTAAWSRRDTETYFSFYDDKQFLPPHELSLGEWQQRVGNALRMLTFLHINISELEVVREVSVADASRSGQKDPTALLQVAFRESYRSNHLQNVSRKLLILGKSDDGWKIYREASVKISLPGDMTVPPGFAIQVAHGNRPAEIIKIRDEWSSKGFQPVVVNIRDLKDRLRQSVRIAYFKSEARAVFYKWLLQLKEDVRGKVVAASGAEMKMAVAATKSMAENGNAAAVPSHVNAGAQPAKQPIPPKGQNDASNENSSGSRR